MKIRPSLVLGIAALCAVIGSGAVPESAAQQTQGLPPSAPPVENYCYQSSCYPTLDQAVQAISNSLPDHPQMKKVAERMEGVNNAYVYKTDDKAPIAFYQTGYTTGTRSSPVTTCQQVPRPAGFPADYPMRACVDENEAVAGVTSLLIDEQSSSDTQCVDAGGYFEYNYILPYEESYPVEEGSVFGIVRSGIGSWANTDPPPYRRYHYKLQCGNSIYEDALPIERDTVYQCPTDYKPINVISPQAYNYVYYPGVRTIVWPNLCESKDYVILKAIKQVASDKNNCNPCHAATGDKSREEEDFEFAGRKYTRYYHSVSASAGAPSWTHTFGDIAFGGSAADKLFRDDGYIYDLSHDSSANTILVPNTGGGIFNFQAGNGESEYLEPDGDIKHFNWIGFLTSIRNPADPSRDVTINYVNPYSPQIQSVVDGSGRALTFSYAGQQLSGISLPDGRTIQYGYDQNSNLVSVDYGNGQIKRYVYGEAGLAPSGGVGLLTGIISEDGQRYGTFGYDQYGRVISSVLLDNGNPVDTTQISYPDGTHAAVQTANGQIRTYQYKNDAYRKPLSIVDNSGAAAYEYDAGSRVTKGTDPRGVVTTYSYTPTYESSRTEAVGTVQQRRIETDREPSLNLITARRVFDVNNVLKSKETWTYNARGQALTHSYIDPTTNAARTTTTTYCENATACGRIGLVLSINGPRTDVNDVSTYSYYLSDDPACTSAPTTCAHRKGDLWKTTNALGRVIEILAYDGAGHVLSVKDTNGVITDFAYTSRGWLSSKTVRGGGIGPDRQTRIEYWPTGLVSFIYQPDNSFSAFTYDNAHRLTDVFDSAGNKIHYTLDNAGNRTKEDTSDPNGALTRTLSRVYNQIGQLQQYLTANNHATTYVYDPNGNVTEMSDALGHSTDKSYDPLGRLAQTLQDTSGVNAATQYGYDANDHLTQVIDPKGLATSYSYNGFGDLVQLVSPDTGTTSYTYDLVGNRVSQTDARGINANYTYDAINRVIAVAYSDSSYNQSYTYDAVQSVCLAGEQTAIGKLTGMQTRGVTTQYCYDRWGQMVRKVQAVAGLSQVTRYTYDVYGRVQTLIYPDGGIVDYVRNSLGQISEVGYTPASGSRAVVVSSVVYAPFGPAIGWNYGNGRHLDKTLTLDYRPNSIYDSQSGGLSYSYGYDAAGNLGALKDGTQTTDLNKFVYDGLNRLTQQQNGLGSPLYTWSYDATGNRTQTQSIVSGTQAYTYDTSSHHLSQLAALTRSYDAVGNTTDAGAGKTYVYGPDNRMGSVQLGTTSVQYAYDGHGQQVLRQGVSTSIYAYDESGHWMGEYSSTGDPKQQIIWLDDLPVGIVTTANAVSALAYIEPDHLGTPRAVIDATRNVAIWSWPLTGEAFGSVQPDQDPDGDGILFSLDMRFSGQRYDSVSGLNQNWNRDYEAITGRYVQSDPLGLQTSNATYSYVDGNPFSEADPQGLEGHGSWSTPPGSCRCKDIVSRAMAMNNDREYSAAGNKGPGPGTNKCNIFVGDVLEPTGVQPRRWAGFGGAISAGTWGDPSAEIPNFPVVHDPQPGDVVAIAHQYTDASGHVAIVLVPGKTSIGAGTSSGSHVTGWPWNGDKPRGVPVYRRCTC
ncbi:RHS repeat-associated core domain-containing protein [Solilutibacter silvestris]|uniref:RHS repeat-associated core domain-containing protein n=1 Tax=Solilutibacter silvestris TaxID=1645665 RepID=UPI003D327362